MPSSGSGWKVESTPWFTILKVELQRLQPQCVRRFYRGGALIGRLRGTREKDGRFPEDWLGSVTVASNPESDDPHEGLSRLEPRCALRRVDGTPRQAPRRRGAAAGARAPGSRLRGRAPRLTLRQDRGVDHPRDARAARG